MPAFTPPLLFKGNEDHKTIKDVFKNIGKMLLVFIITVLITELLYHLDTEPQSLIALYILSTLVVACITPAYIYGIINSLLSTLAFDYFISAPRLGFSYTLGFPVTLIIMLIVTFMASTITMWTRTQAKLALDRESRMQLLYEINQQLLSARSIDSITELTNEYLVKHLACPVVFCVKDACHQEHKRYRCSAPQNHRDLFSSVHEAEKICGFLNNGGDFLEELTNSEENDIMYIPVESKKKIWGIIGVKSNNLTKSNKEFLEILAGQVAMSLEAQYLSDEQITILLDSEKEKMRSTLLRSISHDLRTPLTGILGTCSAIAADEKVSHEHKLLIKDMIDTTKWLIRMIENILIITRISENTAKLKKTPEAPEEVVGGAVAMVRRMHTSCHIQVQPSEEIMLVPMDIILIKQVLINLLENAIKNSGEGSTVTVGIRREENEVKFIVKDKGHGIPRALLPHLFDIVDPRIEQPINAKRGIGIGLSICKTIIQAHNGKIEGFNNEECGATFIFSLPVLEDYDAKFKNINC